MTKHSKVDLLRRVDLLAALTDDELEHVAQITTELRLKSGTVLAREGLAGHECFIIVEGTADISIKGDKVASAGPGEIVGELSLILHDERTATVTASSDMDVLVIEPGRFDVLLEKVPSIARRMLKMLAMRLKVADARFNERS